MSGYIKKGNTWYLNGQQVKVGDQGYDKEGNLNQLQANGTWKTLQRKTKEGIEARKNGLFTPDQYKKWKPKQQVDNDSSLVERGLQSLGMGKTASTLTEAGLYLTPAGNYISGANAIDDFIHGRFKSGLMNTFFAIPIIGNAGRLMKTAKEVAKLSGNAKKLSTLNKVANAADTTGKVGSAWVFGDFGYNIANGIAQGIKSSKNESQDYQEMINLYNQAKAAGYTDQDFINEMGIDKFNQFKQSLK